MFRATHRPSLGA